MKNNKAKLYIGILSCLVIAVFLIIFFNNKKQQSSNGINMVYSTEDQQMTVDIELYQTTEDNTEQETEQDTGSNPYEIHERGWAGDITEETKAEFIDHFMGDGASMQEPFYTFYENDELQLELYYDAEAGVGCGIRYVRVKGSQADETVEMKGFAFDNVSAAASGQNDTEKDIFSVTYYDGSDGSNEVEDYEEVYEYNAAGCPVHYESSGTVDWLQEAEGKSTIIEVDFSYREDGSLYRKDSCYNPQLFGTTGSSNIEYFDEQQRILYSKKYITHGSLEDYYIYDDNHADVAYVLKLDNDLSDWWPVFYCKEVKY